MVVFVNMSGTELSDLVKERKDKEQIQKAKFKIIARDMRQLVNSTLKYFNEIQVTKIDKALKQLFRAINKRDYRTIESNIKTIITTVYARELPYDQEEHYTEKEHVMDFVASTKERYRAFLRF